MSTFVNIKQEEMHSFLSEQGFTEINVPGTHEVVYGKRIKSIAGFPATMRVYTSIPRGKNDLPR